MENNKLNDIYSKKTTTDLIEQIRSHRSTGFKIDQEWFVVLKKHLFERDLSIEEKKELDYVLTADSLELKKNIELNKRKMDENKKATIGSLVDKNNIIAAGKAIKGAVYAVIFLMVDLIIGVIIISKLEDMGSVKDAYVYIGGIGFICNLIILERLYACGNNLENSVIKK